MTAFAAQISCSIAYADGPGRQPDGSVIDREPCGSARTDLWRRLVDEYAPDVVVYYLANVGFVEEHRLDGHWVPECDARYGRYLTDALADEAALLTAGGADLMVATSPYTATMQVGSKDEVDCRNAGYRRFAADHPGTQVVDLNAFVASQIPLTDASMFSDAVHLSKEGSRRASRWLLPQIEEWYGCSAPNPRPKNCNT